MSEEQASQRSPIAPSGSNAATSFGGAIAVIIIVIFHLNNQDFPAGFEAALAVAITMVTTYLHSLIKAIVNHEKLQ